MNKLLSFLGSINRAWVGGFVAFVSTFVVQQFFGIELGPETQDVVTTVIYQLLVSLGVGTATTVSAAVTKDKPTEAQVIKEATKLGLLSVPLHGVTKPTDADYLTGDDFTPPKL